MTEQKEKCCKECSRHDQFCIPSCYPTHCHFSGCKCHSHSNEAEKSKMLKGHHELHKAGGCNCGFYQTEEGKPFLTVSHPEVPEYKYPTLPMVQACVRKMYTLRGIYSEEQLLEMIPQELYEGIRKWQTEARNQTLEEAAEAIGKGKIILTKDFDPYDLSDMNDLGNNNAIYAAQSTIRSLKSKQNE